MLPPDTVKAEKQQNSAYSWTKKWCANEIEGKNINKQKDSMIENITIIVCDTDYVKMTLTLTKKE